MRPSASSTCSASRNGLIGTPVIVDQIGLRDGRSRRDPPLEQRLLEAPVGDLAELGRGSA